MRRSCSLAPLQWPSGSGASGAPPPTSRASGLPPSAADCCGVGCRQHPSSPMHATRLWHRTLRTPLEPHRPTPPPTRACRCRRRMAWWYPLQTPCRRHRRPACHTSRASRTSRTRQPRRARRKRPASFWAAARPPWSVRRSSHHSRSACCSAHACGGGSARQARPARQSADQRVTRSARGLDTGTTPPPALRPSSTCLCCKNPRAHPGHQRRPE